MRKRALARKQVNHDDMWITLPQKVSADVPEVVEGATRTEQPTYEDNWYQVLRKRDDPASEDAPPTAAGPPAPQEVVEPAEDEAPEAEPVQAEPATAATEAPDPQPELDEAPAAEDEVPARPDLAPQVASSLD